MMCILPSRDARGKIQEHAHKKIKKCEPIIVVTFFLVKLGFIISNIIAVFLFHHWWLKHNLTSYMNHKERYRSPNLKRIGYAFLISSKKKCKYQTCIMMGGEQRQKYNCLIDIYLNSLYKCDLEKWAECAVRDLRHDRVPYYVTPIHSNTVLRTTFPIIMYWCDVHLPKTMCCAKLIRVFSECA